MSLSALVANVNYYAERAAAERARFDKASDRLNQRAGVFTDADVHAMGASAREGHAGVAMGTNYREDVARALYAAALAGDEAGAEAFAALGPSARALEKGRSDWVAVEQVARTQLGHAGPVATASGY